MLRDGEEVGEICQVGTAKLHEDSLNLSVSDSNATCFTQGVTATMQFASFMGQQSMHEHIASRRGKRVIKSGDIVWIPPGVKHWHGATAITGMSHIAIQRTSIGWRP